MVFLKPAANANRVDEANNSAIIIAAQQSAANMFSIIMHRRFGSVLHCFGSDRELTAGPASPFSPGGPASRENWVGSKSNIWKPSVAAGVTGISTVGLTSGVLVTLGRGFFGAIVISCLW